jgi:hypothetical protein
MITDTSRTRTKYFRDDEEINLSAYQTVPVVFNSTNNQLMFDGSSVEFTAWETEEVPIVNIDWSQVSELTVHPNNVMTADIHSASLEARQITEWVRRVRHRQSQFGSLRMVDEVHFTMNGARLLPYKFVSKTTDLNADDIGIPIVKSSVDKDPSGHASMWFIGEDASGRYAHHHDFKMAVYKGTEHIMLAKVDTEGWKEFVESSNPT